MCVCVCVCVCVRACARVCAHVSARKTLPRSIHLCVRAFVPACGRVRARPERERAHDHMFDEILFHYDTLHLYCLPRQHNNVITVIITECEC